MFTCSSCKHTFTSNGMLGDTLCEPCGIAWWEEECDICNKVREDECQCA